MYLFFLQKLKKQAKELAKLQKTLAESRGQPGEEDHEKLLQMILNEISQKEVVFAYFLSDTANITIVGA